MYLSYTRIANALSLANPIVRSEFKYQRFVIQNSRSGWLWVGLAVLLIVPALLASVFYSAALLINRVPHVEFYTLPSSVYGGTSILLLVSNLSLYPVVTMVILGLSRNSIYREKSNQTWSILRMTEINSRQIVLGKWWASLKALNGDLGMVIILRIGLTAYYIGVLLPGVHAVLDHIAAPPYPYPFYFVVIVPFIILHALLDGMLTAVVGVIGAIPDESTGAVTTSMALSMRFVLSVLVGFWFAWVMNTLRVSLFFGLMLAAAGVIVTVLLLVAALWAATSMLENA